MFNNLVESTSHGREFKRRGSFMLGVLGAYALLFTVAGVVSVYAFDARLDQQNLELVSLITPVDSVVAAPTPRRESAASNQPVSREREVSIRTEDPPSSDPTKTREGVAVQTTQLPAPVGQFVIGRTNFDALSTGPIGDKDGKGNGGNGTGDGAERVKEPEPPEIKPPTVKAAKLPSVVSRGVMNGHALTLPKPVYPPLALAAHASGVVSVEILVDESGKVISARAVSGNQLLRSPSEKAAFGARFSPTLLSGVPVKVSGVINYEFNQY